jgi:hypothetical protein
LRLRVAAGRGALVGAALFLPLLATVRVYEFFGWASYAAPLGLAGATGALWGGVAEAWPGMGREGRGRWLRAGAWGALALLVLGGAGAGRELAASIAVSAARMGAWAAGWPGSAAPVALAMALVFASTWPFLRERLVSPRSLRLAGDSFSAAAAAGSASTLLWLALVRVQPLLPEIDYWRAKSLSVMRTSVVGGLVVATLAPAVLWLGPRLARRFMDAERPLLPRLLLALALCGFGAVAAWVGTEAGHSLASLVAEAGLAPPSAESLVAPRHAVPTALLPVAVLGLAAAGVRAEGAQAQRRFIGLASLAWAGLVVSHAVEATSIPGARLALAGGVTVAVALGLAVALARDRLNAAAWRALDAVAAAGPPLAASLCGAVIGRIGTTLLGSLPGPWAWLPTGGAALGLLVGTVWAAEASERARPPASRAARALAFACVPGTFFHCLLWCAITEPAWLPTAIGHGLYGVAVASRLPALRRAGLPRVHVLLPMYVLWCVAFPSFVLFRDGDHRAECAELSGQPGVHRILDKSDAAAGYDGAMPYDVRVLGDRLLLSYRRFGPRGGLLEVRDLARPADPLRRARLGTPPGLSDDQAWPESVYASPIPGRYLAAIIGRNEFALREFEVLERTDGTLAAAWTRSLPIPREPTHGALDPSGRLLLQPVMPGAADRFAAQLHWGAPALLERIDLASLMRVGQFRPAGDAWALAEGVGVDPGSGDVYLSFVHQFMRFVLVRLDAAGMRPLRHLETFGLSVGIVADPGTGRLFAGSLFGATLETRDLASLSLRAVTPAGADPGVLRMDPRTGDLWLALYARGTIAVFESRDGLGRPVTPRRRAEFRVGPLVRGLDIDVAGRRVFATSICGVVELPMEPPPSRARASSAPQARARASFRHDVTESSPSSPAAP